MALDFGLLQPANISGQLQAGQESAMRNQLAQQQLASGRTEQEMSQMKLAELKRNSAALEAMQRKFVEHGKSDDMEANYDAMISSGIPHFMDIGIKGKQTLAQTRQDYLAMGLTLPAYLQPKNQATGGAPAAAPGAPAAAPGTPPLSITSRHEGVPPPAPAQGMAPMLDSQGNLLRPVTPEERAAQDQRYAQMAAGGGGQNMPTPALAGYTMPTNALAPAAPAPVNALAAPEMSVEEQRARRMLLSPNPGVRAAGQTELNRLTALHTLAPGGTLRDAKGNIVAQAPEATPSDIRTMQMLGFPPTQAGYLAFKDAQRQDRLLSPTEEQQKIRIALASRTPAQPVAPTVTQIVDPTNPNQMITIDARRYAGGGVGSPGVLGVGGKEPSAALRINKVEEGKTQLKDDLDNLRGSFTRLNEMAALPSTERNVVSNIMSAAQGSTMGQMLGRAGGTEAQVERDVIASAKQRLLTAIKNATGMSAQQLNSNMELQAMLRSLSDVNLGYEASMRIIDDIEDAYVKGAGMKKKNAPSFNETAAAAQGTGEFKYLGKESGK